ncbi:MAG: hypothetical protein JO306_04580 [Gemmatimonadetes bacterium]|nr:hypothetical protein [Gemmatimonadota bacterium]
MRSFRHMLVVAPAFLPAACGEASPTAVAAAAPLLAARGAAIPGAYLVVLRDGTPADAVARAPGISQTLRYAHAPDGSAARLSVALYNATFGDASPAPVDSWIETNAAAGVVMNVPAGTPNQLLYTAAL